MKIAAVMTCFNRRETTIACLERLAVMAYPEGTSLTVFLTDDRSSDGTVDAITTGFPEVRLIHGSGRDYWAGGMRRAFAAAMEEPFDYFLWLNDDSSLTEDALARLLQVAEQTGASTEALVVVGTMCASDGVTPSYGGVTFPSWWRRTTPTILYSESKAIACESFNGNCVLISAGAARVVGNIDAAFTHGLGDFDYGLRVSAARIPIFIAPGFVGSCDRNRIDGTHLDKRLPLARRWALVRGTKAYPPKPWAIFTRRHCGPLWFLYWLFPYVRSVLPGVKKRSPRTQHVTQTNH